MATDLKQRLDEKIRKLQLLRELADDPETVELLKELVSSNGNGKRTISPPPSATQLGLQTPPSTRAGRGEQQRMVEKALAEATDPVDTGWIVDYMTTVMGYEFKAAKPRVAVNECLQTAQKAGRARIARTEGVTHFWEAIKEI